MVADISFENIQLAEVNQENDILEIELYPRPDGQPWIMEYSVLIEALNKAKIRLLSVIE